MSTNKNTFKYLCFVFVLSVLHLAVWLINATLPEQGSLFGICQISDLLASFIMITAGIFFSAKYTGLSTQYRKTKSKVIVVTFASVLSVLTMLTEFFVILLFIGTGIAAEKLSLPFTMLTMPLSCFAGLAVIIFAVLLLCKLAASDKKIKFPRGKYMALCFAPALIFLMFGILNILLLYAFPLMMRNADHGTPALMYMYTFIQDISVGWSIFCMMKYNQSMRIKALLDMQARLI